MQLKSSAHIGLKKLSMNVHKLCPLSPIREKGYLCLCELWVVNLHIIFSLLFISRGSFHCVGNVFLGVDELVVLISIR